MCSLSEQILFNTHLLYFQQITMCERGVFNVGQPPSPIASVGMPTYISTPTNGTPDLNTDSEPHRSSQTPMKCMGHLYYNQQYKTPSINSPGWIGLAQSSPCVQTPGNSSSGSRIQAFGHLRTPSSNHSSKKVCLIKYDLLYH